jgi:hypothetical protein
MSEEHDALDPEIAALLRRGATPDEIAPDRIEAELRRVQRRIAWPRARSYGRRIATFVVGVAIGGAIGYRARPREAPVGSPVASVATSARATDVAVELPKAAPSVEADVAAASSGVIIAKPVPPRPPPSPPATSASAVIDPLRDERLLIDRARSALARADGADALEAVETHAARHPSGALAEEREVLRIRALVRLGRVDEAKQARARFDTRFPNSVFRSTVQRVVEGD